MNNDVVTYRRTELYDQVWKEPVRTVAKRYGVSDVALGKVCRKLRVPVPGLGHWARVRVGQTISRPPLPPLQDGVPSEIVHERWRPHGDRSASAREDSGQPPITVPEDLHNPHKLITETARVLRGKRLSADRCLDIDVSKVSLGRALRIMNALLRALEKRGLQVEVTRPLSPEERERHRHDDEVFDRSTRALVDGEWVKFGITEKGSVVQVPAPEPPKHLRGRERESWIYWHPARREVQPNGTLELSINSGQYLGARRLWHDGKRKRVEGCLSEFVVGLHEMAGVLKQRRADRILAEMERCEEEHRRGEAEQRRRKEAEREKRFEEDLRDWRLARDAREYTAEIRTLLSKEQIAADNGLLDSLQWMDGYAERLDPLTPFREVARGTPQQETMEPGEEQGPEE